MPGGPSNNTLRPDAFLPSMDALRAKVNDHSIKEQDHFRAKQLSPGVYSREGLYSKSEHGKTSVFSNRKPRFDAAKDFVRQAVKEYLGDAKAADRIVDSVLTSRSEGMTKAQLRRIVKRADRKHARMQKSNPARQKRLAAARQKLRNLIEKRKAASSAESILPKSGDVERGRSNSAPAPPKTVVYWQPDPRSMDDGDVATVHPSDFDKTESVASLDDPVPVIAPSGDSDPQEIDEELGVSVIHASDVEDADAIDSSDELPENDPSGASDPDEIEQEDRVPVIHASDDPDDVEFEDGVPIIRPSNDESQLKEVRDRFNDMSDRFVALEGKLTDKETLLFQQLLGHVNDAIAEGKLGEAEALMTNPLFVAGLRETPDELYDKIASRPPAPQDSQPSAASKPADADPSSGVAQHLQHPVQSQAIAYLLQSGVSAQQLDQMVELGTLDNPGLLEDMIRGAGSPEVFARTLVENFNTAREYNLVKRSQVMIEQHLGQLDKPLEKVEVSPNGDCFHTAVTTQIDKLGGSDPTPERMRAAIHDYLATATRTRDAFDAFLQRLPKDVAASLDYDETRREVDTGRILLDAGSGGTWGHVAHALAVADITGRPVEVIGFDLLDQAVKTYEFEPKVEDVAAEEPSDENADEDNAENNEAKPEPIRLIYNGLTHFDAAVPA